MSEPKEQAVESVDGSSFSQDEYELAIENGIEVVGYNDDEPAGEVVEESVEEPSEELKIDESNEFEQSDQEATSEEGEEVSDPFGLPSEQSGEQGEFDDDEFKELPKAFKKRLKRERRKTGRLERELAEIKEMLAQQQAPADQSGPTVDRSQFRTDADYNAYITAQQAALDVARQQQEQYRQQQEYQQLANSWNGKVESLYKTEDERADYVEAISALGNPAHLFTGDVLRFINQSPVGPKMLHYFAEQPGAIQELQQMHPYNVPQVLTNLEQYVSRQQAQTAPAPAVSSKAPAPVGSLTNKSNGVVAKSIDKMSDEELIQAYNNGTLKFD